MKNNTANPGIITLTRRQVTKLLPKRPRDCHKCLFGTVAVIGGAVGMTGAALLAARAALKMGAGCVHVGLLADNAPVVDFVQPELMLHHTRDILSSAPFSLKNCDIAGASCQPDRKTKNSSNPKKNNSVIAIGCGMGCDATAQKLFYDALHSPATLVLDADALNLIATHVGLRRLLTMRKTATVLTPHPGEAARLLSCSTAEIQADRVAAIRHLGQMFHCSIVLKGADSLCATSNGKLFLNPTGNSGMSTPGMGDVLTGVIAAFIAQGLNADDAMLLAVYLHGAAGDALAKQNIGVGMTATELTDQARHLLNKWTIQT